MKKLHLGGSLIRGLAGALAIFACATVADAHPYASGLTNNSGSITYLLNETANAVTITLTNLGTGQTATISGGTNRGAGASNTFSLTQGSQTFSNYSISVQKNGTGVFAPEGPDFTADIFNGPRAVAVNMNPKTHNFGRIYVVNASPGLASPVPAGDTSRNAGKGVFVVNADGSDALGYGTTAHPTVWSPSQTNANSANTGWGTSTTTSPFKIFIGPDDMVYVADASSTATTITCGGTVWLMDPDLVTPFNLLPYIGLAGGSSTVTPQGNAGPVTSRPWVTGSLAQGNLKLFCTEFNFTDGQAFNDIFQYNITETTTAALPHTAPPDNFITGLGATWGAFDVVFPDIYQGPLSGEWYESVQRSGGNGVNGWLFDSTGNTALWNSQLNSTAAADPLTTCFSVAVSPDEKFYAAVLNPGQIIIMNITNNAVLDGSGNVITPATIWAPDLSTIVTNNTATGTGSRGIAFDAADNVIFDTGGFCVMRSYTLGLTTTCVTANDYTITNGTFALTIPNTIVTVSSAGTSAAYKNQLLSTGSGANGPSTGQFTVSRTGDTTLPLTVTVTISGTATNGVDYSLSPVTTTTVTIPAGSASTTVTVTPIHTGVPALTTTVILTVVGAVNYGTQSPLNTATVTISDDNTSTISIASSTNFNSMYEPNKFDYTTYVVTRKGNTNSAATVNVSYSGTASVGDYVAPATVSVNLGDSTDVLKVFAAGNLTMSASNTLIATVTSGSGYNLAATGLKATNFVTYDEVPQGTVLFSDSFSSSSVTGGSSNYTVLFASADNADFPNNYVATPQFDYSTLGIPHAPHTMDGSTLGMFIQADNPANGAAAGVNLYPVLSSFPGVTVSAFSNSYSMRVDMFLIENGGSTIAGTTEYALFGINHSGLDTNWFDDSSLTAIPVGWNFDGLWYDVESDGASLGDYVLQTAPQATPGSNNDPKSYGSASASTLTGIFKYPPYTIGTGNGGAPANQLTNTQANFSDPTTTPSWATVEVDQVGTNVIMKINGVTIISYANTNAATQAFTKGNVMLGYDDAFTGNGSSGAAVIFDNLSVTQLTLKILTIQHVGTSTVLTFSWGLDDPATSFAVQTVSALNTTGTDGWVDSGTAVITRTGVGTYSATIPASGTQSFYKVRHK